MEEWEEWSVSHSKHKILEILFCIEKGLHKALLICNIFYDIVYIKYLSRS